MNTNHQRNRIQKLLDRLAEETKKYTRMLYLGGSKEEITHRRHLIDRLVSAIKEEKDLKGV